MIEKRRKLISSILVYIGIIALVAFMLFHQSTVKQRLTETPFSGPNSASPFTAGGLALDPVRRASARDQPLQRSVSSHSPANQIARIAQRGVFTQPGSKREATPFQLMSASTGCGHAVVSAYSRLVPAHITGREQSQQPVLTPSPRPRWRGSWREAEAERLVGV